MLMQNTAVTCWCGSKSKQSWRRLSVIATLLSFGLTACVSSSPPGVPRLPAPAADLMVPAPTGSAYLESVSAELKALDVDLARWEKMLQDGPTR